MARSNEIYYDAWDPRCKEPFGAVEAGSPVTLRFTVEQSLRPLRLALIIRQEGGAQHRLCFTQSAADGDSLLYTLTFPVGEKGLYFYRFEIETPDGIIFVGQGENARAIVGDFLPEWQLTVYGPDFHVPAHLQQGVMYQIFPDRFLRGSGSPLPPARNQRYIHQSTHERPLFTGDQPDYEATDFFGGDLPGITAKLPYLQELGVTMLYLNPIFEAAGNHRYNTGDYLKIDPYLGTEQDFADLCAEAKRLGIGVILDGVFSHTGSDSVYFNKEGHYDSVGAYQSPESPYASWYHFLDESRSQYDCWWGFTTLPNVNEVDPAFLDFICGEEGVLRHWLKLGASGWRLDVADELPDEFLRELRRCVKDFDPDAYILGEVWEDASNKCSYDVRRPYLLGEELDSVMNYPWRIAILDYMKTGNARPFYTAVMTLLDHYPPQAIETLMTPLSTHDCIRAMTLLGVNHEVEAAAQGDYRMTPEEYALGRELLRQASILQYTLPGFPSLYYGDEAGLSGFADPWNRRCYPWGEEDHELIAFFQRLGRLRQSFSDDFAQPIRFVHLSDQAVAYTRGGLLTAVNRSGEPLTLSFPAEQALISSGGEARTGIDSLTVAPYTAAIFKISSSSPILQRRPFHASTHAAYWRSARGFLQNRSHARRSFKGKIRR
ncbi:MAG: glycoside hydrolase family 13 protein [Oscillospiraceae bacterium]|nr:glycoside hydrolase family 13 protein [Oscillospiraceae bacterium]